MNHMVLLQEFPDRGFGREVMNRKVSVVVAEVARHEASKERNRDIQAKKAPESKINSPT